MLQFPPVMSGHEGRRAQTASPAPPPDTQATSTQAQWGFCSIRSILSACRRRVVPLMLQFPPFAGSEIAVRGGEVAVRGGVAPASQITTATNADNGVSWTRRSALWTQRRLASRVARTRTRYCERQPAISHVNPLFRVWAGLPTLTSAG